MSIEIKGAEQLAALSRGLRQAGEKDLQKELSKGLRNAVKPAKAAIRKSALDTLPSRGGLNKLVANRITPRIKRGNSVRGSQGIRLVGTGKKGMKEVIRLDRGSVRHPVFPDPSTPRSLWDWREQRITPGFWSRPLEALAPEIRAQIVAAMVTVARKIDRA